MRPETWIERSLEVPSSSMQDTPSQVDSGLAQCLQIEPINPVAIPVVDAPTVFDAADCLVPDAGALMLLECRAARAAASTHTTAMEAPGVSDTPATATLILSQLGQPFTEDASLAAAGALNDGNKAVGKVAKSVETSKVPATEPMLVLITNLAIPPEHPKLPQKVESKNIETVVVLVTQQTPNRLNEGRLVAIY